MPGGILPPISVEGSWPTPNYVNPIQRNWALVIVTVLLTVISFLVVCARLWARLKLGSVGIDDVIIIVTMVSTICPITPFYESNYRKPTAIGMSVLICLRQFTFRCCVHRADNHSVAQLRV
jgi:hypothetical protein